MKWFIRIHLWNLWTNHITIPSLYLPLLAPYMSWSSFRIKSMKHANIQRVKTLNQWNIHSDCRLVWVLQPDLFAWQIVARVPYWRGWTVSYGTKTRVNWRLIFYQMMPSVPLFSVYQSVVWSSGRDQLPECWVWVEVLWGRGSEGSELERGHQITPQCSSLGT